MGLPGTPDLCSKVSQESRIYVQRCDALRVAPCAGSAVLPARRDAADGAARLDHPNCLVLDVARGMLYLTEMKGQTVRAIDVSSVLYMPLEEMGDPTFVRDEATRAQIELVASRTSYLNDCFY